MEITIYASSFSYYFFFGTNDFKAAENQVNGNNKRTDTKKKRNRDNGKIATKSISNEMQLKTERICLNCGIMREIF